MKSVADLNHHKVDLASGGHIVVLDPGATLNAEATAMLQALHSRSVGGIYSHLEVLAEKGPEKFMSTFYVGYGHKSIGDCGMAIVFIEGVSMLAAKAIQDSRLYNGQEASTRYIDFASQPFLNPLGSQGAEDIQETWRHFYLKAVREMQAALPARFPIEEGESEKRYEKAIAARAFDTCRGFLPAGASTNLAWTTTLRQFSDRILQLRHHPLAEVREIAEKLEDALIASYPSSFDTEKKRYEATEAYLTKAAESYYHHDPDCPDFALRRDDFDHEKLAHYRELLSSRPPKTELPKWLGAYGRGTFEFQLDFGSFRDLQRHRAVAQRMPLLTSDIGFNRWYLKELTSDLKAEAETIITDLEPRIETLTADPALRQYYLAMGYNISCYLAGDLPSLAYLVELRASSTVHPTLVRQMVKMADTLADMCRNDGLVLHLDPEPGRFNTKRGDADIVRTDVN